jgi:hypothetical protein
MSVTFLGTIKRSYWSSLIVLYIVSDVTRKKSTEKFTEKTIKGVITSQLIQPAAERFVEKTHRTI